MELTPLNLPDHGLEIRRKEDQLMIRDLVRKKWLVLTPEEWVRQHFLNFMIHEHAYPASLLAVEKGIKVNGLSKRCDIIAYQASGLPFLLVECKAPHISINQSVFDQIARYNLKLQVPFLALTNGISHYYCQMDWENQRYQFLKHLPDISLDMTSM